MWSHARPMLSRFAINQKSRVEGREQGRWETRINGELLSHDERPGAGSGNGRSKALLSRAAEC